jgi:hypothetical protein
VAGAAPLRKGNYYYVADHSTSSAKNKKPTQNNSIHNMIQSPMAKLQEFVGMTIWNKEYCGT